MAPLVSVLTGFDCRRIELNFFYESDIEIESSSSSDSLRMPFLLFSLSARKLKVNTI